MWYLAWFLQRSKSPSYTTGNIYIGQDKRLIAARSVQENIPEYQGEGVCFDYSVTLQFSDSSISMGKDNICRLDAFSNNIRHP